MLLSEKVSGAWFRSMVLRVMSVVARYPHAIPIYPDHKKRMHCKKYYRSEKIKEVRKVFKKREVVAGV